jgi:hypothetical protein
MRPVLRRAVEEGPVNGGVTDPSGGARTVALKASTAAETRVRVGDLVTIRYEDHCLLRNVEPSKAQPIIREAIGRVEIHAPRYIYLVFDEYDAPGPVGLPVRKTTGFVILVATILEVKPLA